MPEKSAKIENAQALDDLEKYMGSGWWNPAANAADMIKVNAGWLETSFLGLATEDGQDRGTLHWDRPDADPVRDINEFIAKQPGIADGVWSEDQLKADAQAQCPDCGIGLYNHEVGMGCPPYPLPF